MRGEGTLASVLSAFIATLVLLPIVGCGLTPNGRATPAPTQPSVPTATSIAPTETPAASPTLAHTSVPSPTSVPTATPTPSPTSTPIAKAGTSEAPSEPVEFAIHLATMAREGKWMELRGLMIEEFRDFDLKALEISLQFESTSPFILGIWPTYDAPDSWSVQEFGEATVVRLKEAPMFALTLRRSGDGLLLDPGPLALQWASWRDGQLASGVDPGDLDYPSVPLLHINVSPDEGHGFIFRNLSYDVMGIHRAGTRVEVTTRFELRRGLSGKLATGDIRWHTDTAEGRTDLLWTNAPWNGIAAATRGSSCSPTPWETTPPLTSSQLVLTTYQLTRRSRWSSTTSRLVTRSLISPLPYHLPISPPGG